MNTMNLTLKSQSELRRMKDDTALTIEERQEVVAELNRRFEHTTTADLMGVPSRKLIETL